MDVILLEKVHNLGNLGDKVSVRPGFGRNYLIPRGKAAPATAQNLKKFEERRAELERVAREALAAAEQRAETLRALGKVTLTSKAGEEGKLFGSIGTVDIAEALTQAGAKTEKQEVRLPAGPLRVVGEHEIDIHLHPDVNARITVVIAPEA
ncbi:MAG: 50S ribosomal protein L9 [Gammaproteobacteria bacterium]|nr:MAG: 50S ribosomal protein L9 [Gammaproteobacteria bacterium]